MSFIKLILQDLCLVMVIAICNHICKTALTFVLEVLKIVSYKLGPPILDFHFCFSLIKVKSPISRALSSQEGGVTHLLS